MKVIFVHTSMMTEPEEVEYVFDVSDKKWKPEDENEPHKAVFSKEEVPIDKENKEEIVVYWS